MVHTEQFASKDVSAPVDFKASAQNFEAVYKELESTSFSARNKSNERTVGSHLDMGDVSSLYVNGPEQRAQSPRMFTARAEHGNGGQALPHDLKGKDKPSESKPLDKPSQNLPGDQPSESPQILSPKITDKERSKKGDTKVPEKGQKEPVIDGSGMGPKPVEELRSGVYSDPGSLIERTQAENDYYIRRANEQKQDIKEQSELLLRDFDKIDTDKNGYVTRQEIVNHETARLKAHQANRNTDSDPDGRKYEKFIREQMVFRRAETQVDQIQKANWDEWFGERSGATKEDLKKHPARADLWSY